MNDDKAALARKISRLRKKKGLSWAQVAERIGRSPVWTVAACLGQMAMDAETARRTAELFGLDAEEQALLGEIPYRGALPPGPPTDPTIYRFYELVQVYGTAWKELIHEEFGDGIMSAIDFEMTMERQPDPKGDRVRIVMSGKFLPYRQY
jgi:cyanate lyase